VQQNADTSLSCHHNNTNSKTDESNSGLGPDIGEFESDKQPGPATETRLARDANLDMTDGQRRPWATLKAAFLSTAPCYLGYANGTLAAKKPAKGQSVQSFENEPGLGMART
jgi:hypothetical protein